MTEGAVAAVLLAAGGDTGLEALQQASIATGILLAILLLGACYALYRAFRDERPEDVVLATDHDRGGEHATAAPAAGPTTDAPADERPPAPGG